jgi:hypothetical protein
MATSISAEKKKYTMAGLPPGAVLSILALQSLILLILLLGWVIGQWAWLRQSFPGGLFAGSFPIVVTWAGAAGGIAHAVRGLTTHWSRYVDPRTSDEERERWNAWSLVQGPLGAVYGSAGILLLVVVLGVIGSGSSGNLDLSPAGRLTLSAIAFLIGYHQQIFHDMITRTVEAIFAPRSRPARDDAAYASAVAGDGSQAWQGDAYVELAPDGGQQWTDGGYAEVPAGQGAHAWQEDVPAAADTQTWAEAEAQSWSPESDAAYAGVWTEPAVTQPDETDHDSAGVDAAEVETDVIEEEQTIPVEPAPTTGADVAAAPTGGADAAAAPTDVAAAPTKGVDVAAAPTDGAEVAAAPTDGADGQAAPTDTVDLAPESTRVEAPVPNGQAAQASAILTEAEAVPPEIDASATDSGAIGDAEIEAAEPSPAAESQATTVRRTRTTTPRSARRQPR